MMKANPPSLTLTSLLAPVLTSLLVLTAGCGLLSDRPETSRERVRPQPWVPALYPQLSEGEVRVDTYPDQVVLVRDGRVYGSTGADMPGQVFGMVLGLALSPSGPRMLRVGQIGFGTGVSVSVALASGSRMVDVFEHDLRMVEAGQAIAEVSGLTFEEGAPLNPALRIVSVEQASRERFLRYDVIVSPPATSAVAGINQLITVERLELLTALLSNEGVMVHHLPAYGMEPATYRRFLRTFARAFSHVLVLAAEPGSADTFLVGSNTPLLFRPSALRTLSDNPELADLWRAAHLEAAMDIPARLVFASREEVLDFAEGVASVSYRAPVRQDDLPAPPRLPPPDAPEPERLAWQQAWGEYRERFERMNMFRAQLFGLDWTYGQVCPEGPEARSCLLAGLPEGDEAAAAVADLALSLMAAGRFVEAQVMLESAWHQTPGPRLDRAARVLSSLLEEPQELPALLPEDLPEVRQALAEGRCEAAVEPVDGALADPESIDDGQRLVLAYALVHCCPDDLTAMEAVATLLHPLFQREQGPPLLLYLSARSAMVRGHYARAVWTMHEFVRIHQGPEEEPPPPDEPLIIEKSLKPRSPLPTPRPPLPRRSPGPPA